MDHKLLVANRGEIACRIIKAAKSLGIKTVAVYSEADKDSLHVDMADEAVCIGEPNVKHSYLRMDKILEVSKDLSVTILHPGYGFLSENAEFAQAVLDAGLLWVGPAPITITSMGNKGIAREVAKSAGVPVLPGSKLLTHENEDSWISEGKKIGYPLLVKASAGGGGMGMKQVDNDEQLLLAIKSTQQMAENIFGDPSVYLERYVPVARHVEVQVFGWGNGKGIHLFTRDCSIQRRFQKIIEEAPAPDIPEHIKKTMLDSALALVAKQEYSGAGTVEFVYDVDRQEVYFLEMNTRIQVEHPITELVTGYDLITMQINYAMGLHRIILQEEINIDGCAIEARVCAERPEKGFLPSPGVINKIQWPNEKDWLRIDTGIRQGDQITVYYDSMIAKIIVHAPNRGVAIKRMQTALQELQIEGVSTNINFINKLISSSQFNDVDISTQFIKNIK